MARQAPRILRPVRPAPGRRPVRSKLLDLQSAADRVVRSTCATVGQRVIDIPPNMTTAARVKWIAARITKLGLAKDVPARLLFSRQGRAPGTS